MILYLSKELEAHFSKSLNDIMILASSVNVGFKAVTKCIKSVCLAQLLVAGLDIIGVYERVVRPQERLSASFIVNILTVKNGGAGDL